ncbi:glycosyltransferase family 2 protein [Paenibacillus endoradicis]|uniref:glycosyltransferase family 2 protein n=1 Tax=Paenibacillus endoradicis TaxID=2972487 RepID=UPI0021592AA3|nr:glycosyltransferase family 2 protein [Paenibacillus endoradicis]MCR8659831.1 glycosyltransferase [Paenibacillus endoradicis]
MHTNNEKQEANVSVIIPTLNAGDSFGMLLKLLKEQTIQPHELIIIDSCSDDATVQLAQAAGAKILTVQRTDFDHGGTRNLAADYASGDILMFMTQDVIPVNGRLIENLVKPLVGDSTHDEVVYTYARQIAGADGNLLEKLARANNYPQESSVQSYEDIERLGIKTFFCSNACSAIRRDVFEQMGGFQSPVIFNEDMFMAARCILSGMKIGYCAEAQVNHTHNYTIKQQFKRFFDNGVSMRCNAWIHPYASATKAGSKLVKKQIIGLRDARKLYLIPKLVAESAAKLIGYKLGMNYDRLPSKLCRRMSMHRLIWDQIDRGDLLVKTPVHVNENVQSKSR